MITALLKVEDKYDTSGGSDGDGWWHGCHDDHSSDYDYDIDGGCNTEDGVNHYADDCGDNDEGCRDENHDLCSISEWGSSKLVIFNSAET